ncbi:uncharacterized protein LOC131981474 [Centropristis striata]|uniref:uncharacterized protein LOC131981474 n=1 Tax=Centropristis striata TaxID=184440 RepID=UPI0027E1ED57|nr:uncharacterized protein LOC131981474 [Centropristis striata]
MRRSVSRCTGTDPFRSRCEDRAAALRFVAERVLGERKEEEEEEEEDLSSNTLFSFINSLDDGQWESIRERMREPLTQTHMAQTSRRIISVVTELVYQVLVPVLMASLHEQDFSDASSKKSCKEEDTQSKDSRSSLLMVKPYVEGNVAKPMGSSASQSPARSMLGGIVQQVEQDLSVLAVPPPESPVVVIPLQAEEQVAESCFASTPLSSPSGWGTAKVTPWHDMEQFLEPDTGEVISFITENLDSCDKKTEADMKTESGACKILKDTGAKRSIPWFETADCSGDWSDLDSMDGNCCCWFPKSSTSGERGYSFSFSNSQKDKTPHKADPTVRDGSPLQDTEITYLTPVSSTEVVKDISSSLVSKNTTVSEDRVDNTQEVMYSTATGSCESRVSSMRGVVKSFLDETEQMLKEDDSSVQRGDASLIMLEELISQDQLFTFSKLLADKVSSMFDQQLQSDSEQLDPISKAWSDSDLNQLRERPVGDITPTDQVYVFVEEAVKRLLTSLVFPPSSWGMGHMVRDQISPSSADKWLETTEKYEDVISVYSKLMTDHVMGNLSRTSAASKLQQEVTDPKGMEKFIHFCQELPNKIRRKWRKVMYKEV